MRYPVIIATSLVIVSLGYKYFFKSEIPSGKSVFSWSFILIILSILGGTPLANIADLFSYVIITIVLLNDGYEMLKGF